MGTNRELKEFYDFLNPILQHNVSQFCSNKGIDLEIYPRESTSFWRIVGVYCEEYEDALKEGYC